MESELTGKRTKRERGRTDGDEQLTGGTFSTGYITVTKGPPLQYRSASTGCTTGTKGEFEPDTKCCFSSSDKTM